MKTKIPPPIKIERISIPRKPETPLPPRDLALAAAQTATDILSRNGVEQVRVTKEDVLQAESIFMDIVNPPTDNKAGAPIKNRRPEVILQLQRFLLEYDHQVVKHADQIRMVVTNKLLELANHKDPRVTLRAVELLGKLADVGMFVDKQEVTVRHASDEELKKKLQDRLGLLIEGKVVEDAVVVEEEELPEGVAPLPDIPEITLEGLKMMMNSPA